MALVVRFTAGALLRLVVTVCVLVALCAVLALAALVFFAAV